MSKYWNGVDDDLKTPIKTDQLKEIDLFNLIKYSSRVRVFC